MLINPHLLENPQDQNHNFSRDLFTQMGVRLIKRNKHNIELQFYEKKRAKGEEAAEMMEVFQFSDGELQNELTKFSRSFRKNYPTYKQIVAMSSTEEQQYNRYKEIVSSYIGKPCMIFFSPLRGKSPKLSCVSFSK